MPWLLFDSILVRKSSPYSIAGPAVVSGRWCRWRGRTGDVTIWSTWSVRIIPLIVLVVIIVMQLLISLRIRVTPSGGVLTLKCSGSKHRSLVTNLESAIVQLQGQIVLMQQSPIYFCFREAFKKKKIAEKETLVHSHLTPSLPSLNGTREMGT